jgi:hypothetical protein
MAPLLLCLLLVWAGLCPAFCLASSAADQGPHSCCNHNHKQKAAQPTVALMAMAALSVSSGAPAVETALVTRTPAPQTVDPPAPKQLNILRI